MIDSHAHLYFDWFDQDRSLVFDRARAAGVEHFVVVGIDKKTTLSAREFARSRKDCSAALGIHPNDRSVADRAVLDEMETLLSEGGFCAVGETGLDYHHKDTTPAEQRVGLLRHIEWARRFDLPIIIHCREAWPDLLDQLERDGQGTRGIMHCFSGKMKDMERALAIGYDISFAGPVTYPKSTELKECARVVPNDRFHIETDCPFLPPQKWRGKRNEPSYMAAQIETIAALKGASHADVDLWSTANSRRLFGIKG